jgi:hypothetical protein
LLGAANDEEKVWLEPALTASVPSSALGQETDEKDAASTGYRQGSNERTTATHRPRLG